MASEEEVLAPLSAALRDACAWFDAAAVPAVVIGGVAASFLGLPRTTQDVDVLVSVEEERWEDFLALGLERGFVQRRSDTLDFARRSRALLVRHEATAVDVDVVFAGLPFERDVIKQVSERRLGDVVFPLPRPENLVIMKAVAQRPRDIEDVRGILRKNPALDWEYMLFWTSQFDAALDRADIRSTLERLRAERWQT